MRSPSRSRRPCATYRSVGKLPRSETTMCRPGRRPSAAASSLNRLTEVESATITSCAFAPIRRAILAPRRCGRSTQPCRFQLVIRSSPHCRRTTSWISACGRLGQRPERVAVEVDHAVRQGEALAPGRQRVGGVQGRAGRARESGRPRVRHSASLHLVARVLDHLARRLGPTRPCCAAQLSRSSTRTTTD